MKQSVILWMLLLCVLLRVEASAIYSTDGIKLNHTVVKESVQYVTPLKRNVVLWKSTLTVSNTTKQDVAMRIPCYLYFVYSYLNPAEINTAQKFFTGYKIETVFKNYVLPKPVMLPTKQSVSNVTYFVAFDDVDLSSATTGHKIQFSF